MVTAPPCAAVSSGISVALPCTTNAFSSLSKCHGKAAPQANPRVGFRPANFGEGSHSHLDQSTQLVGTAFSARRLPPKLRTTVIRRGLGITGGGRSDGCAME